MSAQAGVFYFDGRPIAPDVPRWLGAPLHDFGPDGGGEHVGPGLVMVSRALHVTPEDAVERQPFISARGNVMTWDGRLDNREDLLLGLWREPGDEPGDVALAMAVFEKWGVDGFARLIGDWSLALWDAAARTVHLASDYMGVRGLYYRADSRGVQWSSTLSALVSPIRDIGDVDPGFVVGFLTFAIPPETTPYRDVRSVPPAHAVSWAAVGPPARRRFWCLSQARIMSAAPEACAEELRRRLTDAVRGRLRSVSPVWAELSGGLDSSTLVCLAHRLLMQQAAATPALRTISYVSDTAVGSDERPFIGAVEEAIGRPGLHVRVEDCLGSVDTARGWVTPLHLSDTGLAMLRAVRDEGGRTVLSGSGGDLFMGNHVDYSLAALDELVLHGSPLGVPRELAAWSRATQKTIWSLSWHVLVCFAPERLRIERARKQVLAAHGGARGPTVGHAAADLFLLRPDAIDLWRAEIDRRSRRARAYKDIPRLPLIEGVEQLSEARSLQAPSEFPGLSMTFPYAHRPLVEFLLLVPSRVLCAPGRPRALMHEAVDPILPEKIRRRFSKGYAAPILARRNKAVARDYGRRMHLLATVAGGYVDAERLRCALNRMDHGACRGLGNLSKIVDFERWFELSQRHPDERSQMPA